MLSTLFKHISKHLKSKLVKSTLFLVFGNMGKPQGGGGTPLYELCGYVQPQRVWFFSRFGHKLGIDFCTLVFNSFFF